MCTYLITFKWGGKIKIHAKTSREAAKQIEERFLTDDFFIKCVRSI